MNIYFFFIWRLKNLDDYKFLQVWENRYLKNMRRIISGLIILYLVLTIGTGIAFGEINFITGFMAMILVGVVLGYYMVVHFIQFLAIENERYFRIKMGGQSNSINYDNVVN